MKTLWIALAMVAVTAAHAEHSHAADVATADAVKQTKKVCVDVRDKVGKAVKDAATGQPKQSCRMIKQHKKLDGNKVPEKK